MRPLIRLWLIAMIRGVRRAPRPEGHSAAHAPGANPDRVLLLGNGPALGFGVLTWDLSLAGHLGRRLATLTGRGADVEVVARLRMSAAAALDAARGIRFSCHDSLVITIGMNEAMSLSSLGRWRKDLIALLDYVESESTSEFHTFVVANAPARAGGGVPRVFAALISRHIGRLNDIAADVLSTRSRATFVAAAPELAVNLNLYSSASYDRWAAAIAPSMTSALWHASGVARPPAPIDERARQTALDALDILDTPADERFDKFTALARNLFGVSGAAITFLDSERLWMKSAAGIVRTEFPRQASFCDTTIRQSNVFVVEDARLDARFNTHPSVAEPDGFRFYAGYPLLSPEGEHVGAFCISDRRVRRLSAREAGLLRDLALRVQEQLWARMR
ncbi:GAF domain-containing protein [Lacisediminihabitans changchengi]|uniref:GAF domain-containing protein n=1 Tax=Lacisediminihabitans changchengi TaxID=2787634 RepID=A0A934VYE9_9MICO|nr:GAF domain-containing protein [Lacisediminihabitans changchengi]MBK4346905.1 GAF domain-containing protein [Lacisediminihabitans changchengi]MBK4347972.1 GAF domain-containing protein [Lacisediminihabitans changchengi]